MIISFRTFLSHGICVLFRLRTENISWRCTMATRYKESIVVRSHFLKYDSQYGFCRTELYKNILRTHKSGSNMNPSNESEFSYTILSVSTLCSRMLYTLSSSQLPNLCYYFNAVLPLNTTATHLLNIWQMNRFIHCWCFSNHSPPRNRILCDMLRNE